MSGLHIKVHVFHLHTWCQKEPNFLLTLFSPCLMLCNSTECLQCKTTVTETSVKVTKHHLCMKVKDLFSFSWKRSLKRLTGKTDSEQPTESTPCSVNFQMNNFRWNGVFMCFMIQGAALI